jgi:hypothetical protein
MLALAYTYVYNQPTFQNNLPRMNTIHDFKKGFVDFCMRKNAKGNYEHVFIKERKYTVNSEKLKVFRAMKNSKNFAAFKEAYRLAKWNTVRQYLNEIGYNNISLPLNKTVSYTTSQCSLPSFLLHCFRKGLEICQRNGAIIAEKAYGKSITRYAKKVRMYDDSVVKRKSEKANREKEEKKASNESIQKIKNARAKGNSKSVVPKKLARKSKPTSVPAPQESSENNSVPAPAPQESSENNSVPAPAPQESSENNSVPAPAPQESSENNSVPAPAPQESSENNAVPAPQESSEQPAMSFPEISASESLFPKRKKRQPKSKALIIPRESLPRTAKNKKTK